MLNFLQFLEKEEFQMSSVLPYNSSKDIIIIMPPNKKKFVV